MTEGALWALLWGDSGQFHELRIGAATCWVPCVKRRPFMRLIDQPDTRVSFVPRTEQHPMALGPAWVLWVRLERPACAQALARLPIGPTLVVREGRSSRRWALWSLSRPLRGAWITQANERLAYALKGRRGAADASTLMPSPFSPGKAFVEYESRNVYPAREIVGRLRDAPDADGWRAAA
jgi:hypothetical protein